MSPHALQIDVQHGPLQLKVAAWLRDSSNDLFFFVHGLGCSKSSWREAWSRAELRDQSLFAFDFPGFGHTERSEAFDCTLEQHASVLSKLIDSFASRTITLVAHSMGGSISLLLSQRILARLKHLVLVEPRLFVSSCGAASGSADVDFETFRNEAYPRFRASVSRDPRSGFDLVRTEIRAFYDSARSLQQWAASGELFQRYSQSPCPVTFVHGSDNAHLEELAHIDSNAILKVDNAGHFPMRDQPSTFYRWLGARASES